MTGDVWPNRILGLWPDPQVVSLSVSQCTEKSELPQQSCKGGRGRNLVSTLVPSTIKVRGGQRDSKTKQTEDRPERTEPEEDRRDERPGKTGRLGFRIRVMGRRKTGLDCGKREGGDRQINPSLKIRR